jgi:Calcium-binding EGF domain
LPSSVIRTPPRTLQGTDPTTASGNSLLFGLFQQTPFCRKVSRSSNEYQTVRIWTPLASVHRLFFRQDMEGTCGKLCPSLCSHQPCVNDYSAPDAELCTCPTVPVNECGANAVCSVNAKTQTETCICAPGYTGDAIAACVDIDECMARNNPCGPYGTCVNQVGNYTCSCNDGFMLSSIASPSPTCINRNECKEGTPCGPNAECFDNTGSFNCLCLSGYTGNPPTTPCQDIDECASGNKCGPNGTCSNIDGSYTCSCNTGYRSTAPNGGCVDIDECAQPPNPSPLCDPVAEKCTNTPGSYQCSCKVGYTGSPGNCTDVNECEASAATFCGPNASCQNLAGNFTCSCQPDYPGGGPPNCRKLNAWERCPTGRTSDCATSLTCATTSRSDLVSTTCCPDPQRCNTNQLCCTNGAYVAGETCPSQNDLDCRGSLQCAVGLFSLGRYVCCRVTIPLIIFGWKLCIF